MGIWGLEVIGSVMWSQHFSQWTLLFTVGSAGNEMDLKMKRHQYNKLQHWLTWLFPLKQTRWLASVAASRVAQSQVRPTCSFFTEVKAQTWRDVLMLTSLRLLHCWYCSWYLDAFILMSVKNTVWHTYTISLYFEATCVQSRLIACTVKVLLSATSSASAGLKWRVTSYSCV